MDNTLAKLIRASRGPVLLMTLGALLAVHQFAHIGFDQTFPVLIIVFGMMWLLERMAPRTAVQTGANVQSMPAMMAPLPPMEPRDPLAFDPLRDIHQKVYGDVPRASAPAPAPKPAAGPVVADPNRDIPTAEHPIRQQQQNGEIKQ